jgi:glycosyltransferase involved in cell wall biosynthesis
MLGAARELRNEPSIVFVMIGDGRRAAELRADARSEGLSNILFQPYQSLDGLALSLGVADVHWISLKPALEDLVLPSKVYGVLAAGRPIIAVTASDGEVACLVRDHGCGFQVDPGDTDGFARIVRRLAADPDESARLGAAARAAATGAFSRRGALTKWRETLAAAATTR